MKTCLYKWMLHVKTGYRRPLNVHMCSLFFLFGALLPPVLSGIRSRPLSLLVISALYLACIFLWTLAGSVPLQTSVFVPHLCLPRGCSVVGNAWHRLPRSWLPQSPVPPSVSRSLPLCQSALARERKLAGVGCGGEAGECHAASLCSHSWPHVLYHMLGLCCPGLA